MGSFLLSIQQTGTVQQWKALTLGLLQLISITPKMLKLKSILWLLMFLIQRSSKGMNQKLIKFDQTQRVGFFSLIMNNLNVSKGFQEEQGQKWTREILRSFSFSWD